MKAHQNLKGSLILCVASLIWGLAFVAQSTAADKIPPFLLNSLRSFIGSLFLFLLLSLRSAKSQSPLFPKSKDGRKKALVGGLLCGVFLTVAANFQQFGIAYYPVGVATEARAGFLTALYVILVPLFSIFVGKLPRFNLMIAVGVATVGVYLLCLSDGIGSIYLGDLFLLCCAVAFTLHILTVNRYVSDVDGILLSALQFLTCGILSAILSLIFEDATWSHALAAAPQILFLGIASSGIAYTLQIIGQKFAEPTVASITMSLESVFAALGGWLIAGNALSGRELFGCALVFVAIVLAQIPFSWKNLLPNKKRRS